ncbi:MAG: major facilitator superfamily 1 [Humibacillus sp.]|nr:major facilitator superfamily 1 [Humibacillus sp.]
MRTKLLILASSIGMLGWGTVLPYQYAYAANTRGWGALAAALASTLFSVGALVAAPFAGRLSDRFNPVTVAVAAKLLAAVGVGGLVWATSAPAFLTGMFVFGLGLTAAGPAASVLVLRWTPTAERRKVFAYKFTAEAIGMAVGAFVAGQFVDLDRPDGMVFAFLTAGLGFAVSAAIIHVAGIGAPSEDAAEVAAGLTEARVGTGEALRRIFAVPALRWTAVVAVALALGFYAQFESGLPAYALTVLDIDEASIGLAAAVNCVVIVALQVVVVRLTAKRGAGTLLMAVGGIWTLSWVVLSVAQLTPEIASALFVTTFGIFAVGETMYAPVLNPLTATLAPRGLVGTTLGTFTAIQTTFSALGPLVAGALLGLGLANAFLGLHVVISLVAVYAAWRLRGALRSRSIEESQPLEVGHPVEVGQPVDTSRPLETAQPGAGRLAAV